MTAASARRTGWLPRVQHIKGSSPVHAVDPVAKLALLVGAAMTVFILREAWQLLLMLGALFILFSVARLRWWEFVAGARFFLWFSAFIMLVHILFVHRGAVVIDASAGPVHLLVTRGGTELGLVMVARFLIVVLGSFLFVATTEPNALAHSLMRAGVPYRAGFALVLALRLMPLLRSEANAVREAQAARGHAMDRVGLRAAVAAATSTFTPLLVASLSRVDALVVSMEGRAFGRYDKRTFLRQVPWRVTDTLVVFVAHALPLVVCFLRWA
jgi:energy-coupling factor transport system permease protein